MSNHDINYNDPLSVSRIDILDNLEKWVDHYDSKQLVPNDEYTLNGAGAPYSYDFDEAQRKIMITEAEERVAKKFNSIYFVPAPFKLNEERDYLNKRDFEIQRQVLRRQDGLQSLFEDIFKSTRDPRVSAEVDNVLKEIDNYAIAYNLSEIQKEQLRIEVLKSDLVNFVNRGRPLDAVGIVAGAAEDLSTGAADGGLPPGPGGLPPGPGGAEGEVPGNIPGGTELPDIQPNFQPDLGAGSDVGGGAAVAGMPEGGKEAAPGDEPSQPAEPVPRPGLIEANFTNRWLPGEKLWPAITQYYDLPLGERERLSDVGALKTMGKFVRKVKGFGEMSNDDIARHFRSKGVNGKGRSVKVKELAAVVRIALQMAEGSKISDEEYQELGIIVRNIGFYMVHSREPQYLRMAGEGLGGAAATEP